MRPSATQLFFKPFNLANWRSDNESAKMDLLSLIKLLFSVFHYRIMLVYSDNSKVFKRLDTVVSAANWRISSQWETCFETNRHRLQIINHLDQWCVMICLYHWPPLTRCGAGRWKRIATINRYTDLINQAIQKFRIGLQPVSWAVAFALLVDDCVDIFHWMLFLE